MYRALIRAGKSAELKLVPGATHAPTGEQWAIQNHWAAEFFQRHLREIGVTPRLRRLAGAGGSPSLMHGRRTVLAETEGGGSAVPGAAVKG